MFFTPSTFTHLPTAPIQTFPLCPLELTPLLINSSASSVYRILSSPLTVTETRLVLPPKIQIPKVQKTIYVLNLVASDPIATTATSSSLLYSSSLCKKKQNTSHLRLLPFNFILPSISQSLFDAVMYKLPIIFPALRVNFTPRPQIQPIIPRDFTACGYRAIVPFLQVLGFIVSDFWLHFSCPCQWPYSGPYSHQELFIL